jgi:probable HAF family extracellular repeat protein
VLIALVLGTAGVPGAWGQQYALVDLGTLGGTSSMAQGVNASGAVVGFSANAFSSTDAFLYCDGDGLMDDLAMPGSSASTAAAISRAGYVAGAMHTAGNIARHAFLYKAGVMLDLGTLGGFSSAATGISPSGVQVVGQSRTATGVQHAFVYAFGAMNDLGTLPGGGYSSASAVNTYGEIVGDSDSSFGDRAVLFTGGAVRDIGTLGGTHSMALAINDFGQIVGESDTANGSHHAFISTGGVMRDLGTLGGTDSSAAGINALGQIVGSATTVSGHDHAFLYSSGSMHDLNNLIGSAARLVTLTGAQAIASDGRIAAMGMDVQTQQPRGYLLTPVSPYASLPPATCSQSLTTTSIAAVGIPYVYRIPPASSGMGVKFSISTLPSWARFDATTGTLSGTPRPGDAGTATSITVTVGNGSRSSLVDNFVLSVPAAPGVGVAALSWQPPASYTDGSLLNDLGGYIIYFGHSATSLNESVVVPNPGLTSYRLGGLKGTYYFAVLAYSAAGAESVLSPVVSATF